MGALIASPESGDASANVMPQTKKRPAISYTDRSKSFISSILGKDRIDRSSLTSTYNSVDVTNEDLCEQMVLIENGVLRETRDSAIQLENCRFPYYRTGKSNGRFPDAVLVKDVGVSCTLLTENITITNRNMSISGIESFLVKQLKKEYSDLSNITNKITAYTKDILNNLPMKDRRKNRMLKKMVSGKRVTSSQYIDDRGNLCLKLRLFADAESQCSPQKIVSKFDDTSLDCRWLREKLHDKEWNKQSESRKQTIMLRQGKSHNEKQVQTFSKQEMDMVLNSPECSTSSTYDYVNTKRRKSSNESLKSAVKKFENVERDRSLLKKWDRHKDQKENLKNCDSVIFTNWQEISRSKAPKNKTASNIPNGSRQAVRTVYEKQNLRVRSTAPPLHEKCLAYYTTDNYDTKLHTVNIRIIKRKHRYT